jgi:UDP-N-acetylglucosamine 4-epimerase
MIKGETVFINGDGETSRDFCYIDNCVQANLRACLVTDEAAGDQVYNVAYGERTTLNELFYLIRDRVAQRYKKVARIEPVYRDFRPGDVRHSLADISKARTLLGYQPEFSVTKGLDLAANWYMDNLKIE